MSKSSPHRPRCRNVRKSHTAGKVEKRSGGVYRICRICGQPITEETRAHATCAQKMREQLSQEGRANRELEAEKAEEILSFSPEIVAAAEEIRERGFYGTSTHSAEPVFHPPWSEEEEAARRGGTLTIDMVVLSVLHHGRDKSYR